MERFWELNWAIADAKREFLFEFWWVYLIVIGGPLIIALAIDWRRKH